MVSSCKPARAANKQPLTRSTCRVTTPLAWVVTLQVAMARMRKIRRYCTNRYSLPSKLCWRCLSCRRTSPSTNNHPLPRRVLAEESAKQLDQMHLPSFLWFTLPHDASSSTYECNECMTTCCSKRNTWRTKSAYARPKLRTLQRQLQPVGTLMLWTEMLTRGAELMIWEEARWALAIWRRWSMMITRSSPVLLGPNTTSPSCLSSTRTFLSPELASCCTTNQCLWWVFWRMMRILLCRSWSWTRHLRNLTRILVGLSSRYKKSEKLSSYLCYTLSSTRRWASSHRKASFSMVDQVRGRRYSPRPSQTRLALLFFALLGVSWSRSTSEMDLDSYDRSSRWPPRTHLLSSSSTRSMLSVRSVTNLHLVVSVRYSVQCWSFSISWMVSMTEEMWRSSSPQIRSTLLTLLLSALVVLIGRSSLRTLTVRFFLFTLLWSKLSLSQKILSARSSLSTPPRCHSMTMSNSTSSSTRKMIYPALTSRLSAPRLVCWRLGRGEWECTWQTSAPQGRESWRLRLRESLRACTCKRRKGSSWRRLLWRREGGFAIRSASTYVLILDLRWSGNPLGLTFLRWVLGSLTSLLHYTNSAFTLSIHL